MAGNIHVRHDGDGPQQRQMTKPSRSDWEAPRIMRALLAWDPFRELTPLQSSGEQLVTLYRWMLFGRLLDERGLQLQRQGRVGVWGPMIGQEAAQAGLGLAMQDGDWIFPSYREAITLLMRRVVPVPALLRI